jgi:hypothetical protein
MLEMTIGDVASYLSNDADQRPVRIILEGVDDTKGLFCYCLDLLARVLGAASLGDVGMDGFLLATSRMRRAGIDVRLTQEEPATAATAYVDTAPAASAPDGLALGEYRVYAHVPGRGKYSISFGLL